MEPAWQSPDLFFSPDMLPSMEEGFSNFTDPVSIQSDLDKIFSIPPLALSSSPSLVHGFAPSSDFVFEEDGLELHKIARYFDEQVIHQDQGSLEDNQRKLTLLPELESKVEQVPIPTGENRGLKRIYSGMSSQDESSQKLAKKPFVTSASSSSLCSELSSAQANHASRKSIDEQNKIAPAAAVVCKAANPQQKQHLPASTTNSNNNNNKYEYRKIMANSRPRVNGRFTKIADKEEFKTILRQKARKN